MIILTEEQAEFVRGPTSGSAALEPRQLESGEFVLNEGVLNDPAHAALHEYLAALPRRDVGPSEFPVSEE